MTRISSIIFDRSESPARATIITPHGPVRVEWIESEGVRVWVTTKGSTEARKLAVPAIYRIERLDLSERS